MNNDNIKSVATASATNNEKPEQAFDSKSNFKARKNKSWKNESGWDK
jgi:hypothetical protein